MALGLWIPRLLHVEKSANCGNFGMSERVERGINVANFCGMLGERTAPCLYLRDTSPYDHLHKIGRLTSGVDSGIGNVTSYLVTLSFFFSPSPLE